MSGRSSRIQAWLHTDHCVNEGHDLGAIPRREMSQVTMARHPQYPDWFQQAERLLSEALTLLDKAGQGVAAAYVSQALEIIRVEGQGGSA